MRVVEIRGLGFRENFQDGTLSNGSANGTQGGSIEVLDQTKASFKIL